MKTRYFKNIDEYFRFIDMNRNKKIKTFLCSFTKNILKLYTNLFNYVIIK